MIGIKVNSEFLYLPADFNFTLEENNPMLVDDSGAFTKIPVRVPRCTHNDNILSFWADIDRASNSNPEPDCIVYKKNNPEYYGSLVFISSNEKYYETYFKSDRAKFNAAAKAFNLNDIDYKEQISTEVYNNSAMGEDLKDYVTTGYPDNNLTFFPVYMPYADFEFDPLRNKFINFWHIDDEKFVSYWGATNNIQMICPFFYMRFVITKVCETLGYVIVDDFFESDPIFDKLIVFNLNAKLGYENLSGSYASFERDLPSATCYDFIKSVEEYFNVTFYPNEKLNTLKIISNQAMVISKDITDISQYSISGFRKEIRTINGINLIPNVDDDDSYFADNVSTANYITLSGEAETYADLPAATESGIYYLDKEYNNIYVSKESYFENYVWINTGYNYVAYKEGSDELLTKNFKASTLMMGYNILDYEPVHNSSYAAQVLLPLCYIERTIINNMYDNKLGKIKFLFAMGWTHAKYTMFDESDKYLHIGTVEDETDIPSWNGGGTFGSLPTADYLAGASAAVSTKVYVLNSDKTYYLKDLGGSTYQWTETSNNSANGVPYNCYPFGTNSYYYYTGSNVLSSSDNYKYSGAWLTLFMLGNDCIFENFYPDYIYWLRNQVERGYMEFIFPENFRIDFTKKYRVNGINYIIEKSSTDFKGERNITNALMVKT